jgi:hypothetical protein
VRVSSGSGFGVFSLSGANMKAGRQKGWLIFWCCFVLMFFVITVAQSAIVDLIAYVSYSLKDSSGAPLADGSIVMIYGSTDAVNNGPRTWGGTNLIADSVQGDDVYIGMVRIDQVSYGTSNGTFYTANEFSFDEDSIKYLYIRIFNTTINPVEGYYQWTSTPVFGFTSEFGKVTVDFVGNYLTSVTNNFVVIPEPSTSHLLLVFFGLAFGMRAVMKKDAHKPRKPNCR